MRTQALWRRGWLLWCNRRAGYGIHHAIWTSLRSLAIEGTRWVWPLIGDPKFTKMSCLFLSISKVYFAMKTIVCMLYKYIFTNTYEYYELPGWLQLLDPWDKPHLRCLLRTSLIPTKEWKSGWRGRFCGSFGSFWKRRLREGDANTPGPRSQSSGKSGMGSQLQAMMRNAQERM
jgi:hypothetical protein